MNETLIIKNFGPIKDVTLDLKKVNVLIGDQGTGKSTVAKVYALVKTFIYFELFDTANNNFELTNEAQFLGYCKLFGIENYVNQSSQIYFNNDIVHIEYNKSTVKREFKSGKKPSIYESQLTNYIVAERVFVSLLSDALFGLNELGVKLPSLFNRFGTKYSAERKKSERKNYLSILGVDFSHINGIDSVILRDEKIIPLSDASSGVQGTIPLLVVYDSLVDVFDKKSRLDFERIHNLVIEEPELNLFPETQKKLLNHLVGNNFIIELVPDLKNSGIDYNGEEKENFENKGYKNQLFITTHSPYILSSLNNLMYAYSIGQEYKSEVNEIISEKFWLNPVDVSAYMLVYDEVQGGCIAKNIIDPETQLIDSIQIDGVSDILSEEFNKIMAIKLGA